MLCVVWRFPAVERCVVCRHVSGSAECGQWWSVGVHQRRAVCRRRARALTVSLCVVSLQLDPGFTWQMLRDHFREVGEVRYADMKGKGVGVVRFSSPHEAQRAISLMDGSRCDGRTLDVRSY